MWIEVDLRPYFAEVPKEFDSQVAGLMLGHCHGRTASTTAVGLFTDENVTIIKEHEVSVEIREAALVNGAQFCGGFIDILLKFVDSTDADIINNTLVSN